MNNWSFAKFFCQVLVIMEQFQVTVFLISNYHPESKIYPFMSTVATAIKGRRGNRGTSLSGDLTPYPPAIERYADHALTDIFHTNNCDISLSLLLNYYSNIADVQTERTIQI